MLLLAIAATSVCLAVAIIVYLLATARSEPTGVARSLAIVERRIDRHEVDVVRENERLSLQVGIERAHHAAPGGGDGRSRGTPICWSCARTKSTRSR